MTTITARGRTARRADVRALDGRFARLAERLPRVALGVEETPVEEWLVDGVTLLVKRDDLSAATVGGNKVRALELLLAGVSEGQRLLTVGPTGSTHALAAATHGARIGARTEVITWPQESHEIASETAARLERLASVTHARTIATAYLRAGVRRMRGGVRWIPAGGSSPLGAVAHASAALEAVEQITRDGRPMPDVIVVPLGSGGTTAGLLLGLAIAGVRTRVVGVRVVPRAIGNRWRVLRLARQARALLSRRAGESLPQIDGSRLAIAQGAYGGAYGRETAAAVDAARLLRDGGGPRVDGTYSAKAFAHALELARHAPDQVVLFWLTFDARWLGPLEGPRPTTARHG